jgi:hypothetical protein
MFAILWKAFSRVHPNIFLIFLASYREGEKEARQRLHDVTLIECATDSYNMTIDIVKVSLRLIPGARAQRARYLAQHCIDPRDVYIALLSSGVKTAHRGAPFGVERIDQLCRANPRFART